MTKLDKLEKDIKKIKATQERILAIVEDALCSTTSEDFERKQLIAQYGGDVLAALKEHNRRYDIRNPKSKQNKN